MSAPLTHNYRGPAKPVTASAHKGYLAGSTETISGAFRIVTRVEDGVILGNGEKPNEGMWIVALPRKVAA